MSVLGRAFLVCAIALIGGVIAGCSHPIGNAALPESRDAQALLRLAPAQRHTQRPGASPSPSASASASAAASATPSTAASASATPAPSATAVLYNGTVLSHVPTGDYCCGGYHNDTPSGGLATAKPWITYYANPDANGSATYPSYGTPGLAAAGISPGRVYVYSDDSRIYRGDTQYNNIAPGGADSAAEARNCAGSPVTVNGNGGYLSDPYQATTLTLYDNDVTRLYNYSSEYGMVFLDDVNGYGYTDNGMPCRNGLSWAQTSTSAAYASTIAAITVSNLAAGHLPPVFLLNALNPMMTWAQGNVSLLLSEISSLTSPANVVGLDCESCLADGTNPAIGNTSSGELTNQWTLVENAALALVNAHKIFWLQNQDASSSGSTSYAGRIFSFASFMLIWDPTYTVYQNAYYGYPGNGSTANSTNPQIHVFPEEALVAYNPLVPYPSSIATLQDAGGSYVREYQSCYYSGTFVGACAFVVNPDAASHPKPALRGTYSHTLAISSQSSIIDGGTVSVLGAAPPSTIPGTTGYVLLP
jgi:hypothetical protein